MVKADIVGPICESGDFLAKNREVKEFEPGELLAVMSAGCASFYKHAELQAPSANLDSKQGVLISQPPDGFYGSRELPTRDEWLRKR